MKTTQALEVLTALIGNPSAALAMYEECQGSLINLAQNLDGISRSVPGIGPATRRRLEAGLNVGRILRDEAVASKPTIHSPSDAYYFLQDKLMCLIQEELWVMLLNTRNVVLSTHQVYKGSLNTSQIRVGEVFRKAIIENAASIILAHNHPSGDPAPSPNDVAITRAIIEAGRLLDIEVLDHLIIGHGRFVSMKERKLSFE